jgi:DNA-binding transcriptional LysR family regulator
VADGEEFVPLWTERYVVALPLRHPLAARDQLRRADLVGARLIERCYCEYADRFARVNPRFDVVAVAPSEEWALAMVAAGLGIAILPEGVVRRKDEVAVRAIVDADVTRQVGLAYASSGAPEEVQRLVARLRPGRERSVSRGGARSSGPRAGRGARARNTRPAPPR